jgi:hypothetical protein
MLATITHIQGDILVEESEGLTHDQFMNGGEEVVEDFADGIGETSTCTTGETKRYAREKKKGKTSWKLVLSLKNKWVAGGRGGEKRHVGALIRQERHSGRTRGTECSYCVLKNGCETRVTRVNTALHSTQHYNLHLHSYLNQSLLGSPIYEHFHTF